MNKRELKEELKKVRDGNHDPEDQHHAADRLLLKFIGDPAVTRIYNAIPKWYA